MKHHRYYTIGIVVVVLVLAWINRYQYIEFHPAPIRVNRFTGTIERLTPRGGWVVMH